MEGPMTWNFFEDILPPEVTTAVFSFLELEDIVYVSLVCKTWSTYFDTKDIWKHIYEKNFGKPDGVDLNQKFRWRRLVRKYYRFKYMINQSEVVFARNLYREKMEKELFKYAPNFSSDLRQSPAQSPFHFFGSISLGAYFGLSSGGSEHNPVTLYHSAQTDLNSLNLTGIIDTKPPKDDVQYIPEYYGAYSHFITSNGQGDFMYKDDTINKYGIMRAQNIRAADGKMNTVMLTLIPESGYCTVDVTWTFNSKFAAYIEPANWNDAAVLDLNKQCVHCCVTTLENGGYIPHRQFCACPEQSTSCAVIERISGPFISIFASQADPNLIVLFKEDKIVLWRHKGQANEINLTNAKKFNDFSEHLVEIKGQKRHWFRFTYLDDNEIARTKFIDLNDPTYTLGPFPGDTTKYLWVPKKNKVVCSNSIHVTVVDLENKRRVVKFDEKNSNGIRAMTLSKSGAILFLATDTHLHAYQWETARLIDSFAHDNRNINMIHFAMDQVLIICSRYCIDYKKINTKLDF